MLTEASQVNVVHVVRPMITAERNGGAEVSVKVKAEAGSHHTITIEEESGESDDESTYPSELCFPDYDTSLSGENLYGTCTRLVKQLQHGLNSTIITIGSSQSGKTTILAGCDKDVGLGARAMRQVTSIAKELRNRGKSVLLSFAAAEFVPLSFLREGEGEAEAGIASSSTKIRDLLNPHGRPMRVVAREPVNQVAIDGLTEIVLKKDEHLEELFLQASRLRRFGVQGDASHFAGSDALYRVQLAQCDQGQKMRVISKLDLVDTAGYGANGKGGRGVKTLASCIESLGSSFQKGRRVPIKDSLLTHSIMDAFGGNTSVMILAAISPSNKAREDTKGILKLGSHARNMASSPSVNVDQTDQIIDDTRKELMKRKDLLSEGPSSLLAKEEILEMEKLVEQLKLAKLNSFEEKMKRSEEFLVERIKNLATVGMLDFVMKSGKRGLMSERLEAQLASSRISRDAVTNSFREQRKKVDAIKADLDKKINEYAAKVASDAKADEDEEMKRIVKGIHDMKEQMATESAELTRLREEKRKHQDEERRCREAARFHSNEMLEKVPEILLRSEAEERRNLANENKEVVERKRDELKAELVIQKLQAGDQLTSTATQELNLELQHELAIAKMEARFSKDERDLLETHLETNLKRQERETEEIEKRHSLIFREYRQSCENQKMAVDSRYRQLLDDAIQDAVFLSARNTELKQENMKLKRGRNI